MKFKGFYEELQKAMVIASKDIDVYYFKPPAILFGVFFPITLYFAFTFGRPCVSEAYRLTGIVTIASLFGSTTSEAMVLPLERRTRTFERLVVAPISIGAIVLGKMISGVVFGFISALVVSIILIPLGSVWTWLGFSTGLNIEPGLYLSSIVMTVLMSSSLGMVVSVRSKGIESAMMLLTFIRIILVFLCGVFIPLEETFVFMPSLQFIAYLLPLTYSVEALQQATFGPVQHQKLLIDFSILAFFTIVFIGAAIKLLKRTLRS